MKKNLKMELLNSEVEQQVQGGAGRFAADFTMPGGSASNSLSTNFRAQNACVTAYLVACTTVNIKPCVDVNIQSCATAIVKPCYEINVGSSDVARVQFMSYYK